MHLLNENQYYPFISAFYALHLPEFHMNSHRHKSLEIMYVTKGCCTIFLENESICLEQRQFIFLDSQILHRLSVTPGQPCSMLNLEFFCQDHENELDLRELAAHCPSFIKLCKSSRPYHTGIDTRNLGYALKDFISQLENPAKNVPDASHRISPNQLPNQKEQDSYLLRLLFFRMMLELSLCLAAPEPSAGLTYLKRACSYIQENLTEELRIPEIAAYAGINKSYLQALFRRSMDTTITDYINRKKLEQAAFLLTNSSMNITDIGFSCGYNSRQHFGHTFEKFYGCSPKAYRQLHRTSLSPSTGNAQHIFGEDGSFHKAILS